VSPGARRAVASVGIVVFLLAYVVAAISIAAMLPDVFWIELAYYAIVGTAWGLPLLPLIRWAGRTDR
jgi:hypothetical protein